MSDRMNERRDIRASFKPLIAFSLIIIIFISVVACGPSSESDASLNEGSAVSTAELDQVTSSVGDTPQVTATSPSEDLELTSPSEDAETDARQPKGELLIWVEEANQDVWEKTVLAAFQDKFPQVDIKIENYSPKDVAYNIGVARRVSRPVPDLAVSQYRDIQSLIARDDLLDITSWMESHTDKFNPKILDYCTDGTAFYCVPWYVGPTVLFYRRDIFEAAGLPSDPESVSEMVATWDEFLATCKTVKRRTGSLCMPYIYRSVIIDMMRQQGISFVDQKGEVNIDDPAIVSIVEKIKEFRDLRLITKNANDTAGLEYDLTSDLNNKEFPPVATIIYPSWIGHSLKHQFEKKQEGNWGVTLMPAWEEGGIRASMGSGSAYFIPKESSNPEAAWAFIEFMALNEENQLAQFAYSDYLPALTATYEDPLFFQEDPYYGGQRTRLLFAEVINNVPDEVILETNLYPIIIDEVDTAVNNFFVGRMDAQQALQEAAQNVRLKLEIR